MHYDGTLASLIVVALLKSVESQRVAVVTVVCLTGEIKTQRTLMRVHPIGEEVGIIVPAILAMTTYCGEEQPLLCHIYDEHSWLGRWLREVYHGEYLSLLLIDMIVSSDRYLEGTKRESPPELKFVVETLGRDMLRARGDHDYPLRGGRIVCDDAGIA